MKKLIALSLLLSVNFAISQNKFLTKTGVVNFEASVPSFEEVKAKNENTTAILNTGNGEFAALVLVKGFRFKNALMEEHFNENYAESDEFPKATFKGTISNFNIEDLNSSEKEMEYNGTLTFHGKTKTLDANSIKITLNADNTISLSGEFKANVSDFDIKIPKVVSNKLSKTVDVSYNFTLTKK
ncbi:YceI family protein [uncultured Lacinutrix sp.]|uniref:YceI family protein n=1 Tax=uncultured Lacinutrix sp. TaxID=574032 RepID=UPI00261AA3E0|nr:YceI family protein [uncultured Lacinutrix sp.]